MVLPLSAAVIAPLTARASEADGGGAAPPLEKGRNVPGSTAMAYLIAVCGRCASTESESPPVWVTFSTRRNLSALSPV